MESKFTLSGLIGYGILGSFYIVMLTFGSIMCSIRWQEFIATGTTSNSMSFSLLVFTTVCLIFAILLVGAGIIYYIVEVILYNKERKLLDGNRKI